VIPKLPFHHLRRGLLFRWRVDQSHMSALSPESPFPEMKRAGKAEFEVVLVGELVGINGPGLSRSKPSRLPRGYHAICACSLPVAQELRRCSNCSHFLSKFPMKQCEFSRKLWKAFSLVEKYEIISFVCVIPVVKPGYGLTLIGMLRRGRAFYQLRIYQATRE
jgi:hypothetical protein